MIDNSGAKSLIKSTTGTKRSRYHNTREAAAMGAITIHGIPSNENAADGFTKLPNRDGFDRFLCEIAWDGVQWDPIYLTSNFFL